MYKNLKTYINNHSIIWGKIISSVTCVISIVIGEMILRSYGSVLTFNIYLFLINLYSIIHIYVLLCNLIAANYRDTSRGEPHDCMAFILIFTILYIITLPIWAVFPFITSRYAGRIYFCCLFGGNAISSLLLVIKNFE